jgi:periplasmic mercuric ion binding protein
MFKDINCPQFNMRMKSLLLSLVAVLALTPLTRAADVTVTLSKVHLCCDKCVKGVNKTVSSVDGVTAVASKTEHTIVLTAADSATLQKAVDALVKDGFFGESSDPSIKVDATTGAKGEKVQTLKVKGVHLCCPSCVKAVNKALADVPGVTGNTCAKGAESFEVTGDFKDSDVFDALQKAGLTGKVGE